MHHACHSPCSFPPSHVPGQLLPLIRGSRDPELGFLAYVGSSSAFYNSLYNTGSNNRHFYGDGAYNHALWRIGGGVTLLKNGTDFHFGQTGATASQLLTAGTGMVDLAIAAAEAAYAATGKQTAIIASIILNNIGNEDSVATMQGYVEDLIGRCEAANNAVKLIIPKAWPRLESETNSAAKLALRLDVNEMLETVCAANGVVLSETADVGDDGSGYLLTTWSDAVAPGHGAIPFAARVGNIIYADIVANFRVPTFDLWDYQASMYAGKNPEFAGTGGSNGRPDGWATNNNGASTHTWSTVDYGDGSGRKWMRMVCEANGGNGSAQVNWAAGATTGFNIGDVVELMCEIRFPTATGFDIGAVNLSSFMGGTFLSPTCGIARVTQQTPPIAIEYHTDTVVLRSIPTIITTGTTSFDLRVAISGSGTVDVGTACAFVNGVALPQYYP